MLTDLCQELRNWFVRDIYLGDFTIANGSLDVTDIDILDGQYYRIIGSVFSDGVHQYNASNPEQLTDEVFEGAIWTMAVPPSVIELSERISAWKTQYGDLVSSPYSSESFGGYSYSKAYVGRGQSSSNNPTWQNTFADELNRWRKL